MKKVIILLAVLLIGFTYGSLVVIYEIFPYNQLKTIRNKFEDKFQTSKSEEDIQYSQIKPENLISVSPNNIDSLRLKLNTILFGTKSLPAGLPDTVLKIEDELYSDIVSLNKIEQFKVSQNFEINSKGYIFHPKKPINRLVIYHQGHGGDFFLGKTIIASFLNKGFTVYAFSMPVSGKNNRPKIYLDKLGEFTLDNHEKFKYLDNPLKYFITPVITMLNYAESKSFDDVTMVGLSGGGWTTTLTAAVDMRIRYSFPVAGTYPMYIRLHRLDHNYGDFEQNYNNLYTQINYMDMYIMGAAGKGRSQIQILNKYDSCCFDDDDYKSYNTVVSAKVSEFDEGHFEVFSDSSHSEHKISKLALSKIFEIIQSTSINK